MKKYNKSIRFATIILMCFMVIEFNVNFSHAIDDIDTTEITNTVENYSVNVNITPIISAPVVDINSSVRVSFDNTGVLSYSVETDGLIATEVTSGSMEYDIVATEEFGVFDVYIAYPENVVIKSSVYTYKSGNKVYVSDISKDQAWYNWLAEQMVEGGEYAVNVAQELYYELCKGYTKEYAPSANELLTNDAVSGKTIVQGKLFWQEDVVAPLIKVKVQLIKKVDGMTHIISSQYTNPDGSFRFEIDNFNWSNNGEDIFIRWWLEAETFKVTNNWILDHYCFQSSLRTNVAEGTIENFYYVIPKDEDLIHYKATCVHQAMTISERFAIDMGMTVPNYNSASENKTKLNVSYPALLAPEESGYSFGNDLQSLAAIGQNRYYDVDMITHEYGHYVQYLMGIYGANLLEIACNGPQHHPLEDHMLDNFTKEYAMELTWSEAWASTFSTLSEHYYWYKIDAEYEYFDNNIPSSVGIMGAVSYNSCLGWNLETPNNGSYNHDNNSLTPAMDNRGEFQEASVWGLLWDLYDENSNSETFDQINLGYQNWWNYTTISGMYTLEDFTQYMCDVRPDLRDNVGKIMSYYKIAPEIINISNSNKTQPPTVTLMINGSQEHPNNQFEIAFYDNNGNLLGKTDIINLNYSHRSEYHYTISASLWNSILEQLDYRCDNSLTLNMVISSYRDDFTIISDSNRKISGPYYSGVYSQRFNIGHDYEYIDIGNGTHEYACATCNITVELEHDFVCTKSGPTHHTICKYCDYRLTGIYNPTIDYNNESHTLKCDSCNFNKTVPHTMAIDNYDSTSHKYYCTDCNYFILEEHNNTYANANDFTHTSSCTVCEYEGNEHHSIEYADLGDGTHSESCEECEYYLIENHTFVCKSVDGTYHRSVCDACGLVNGPNQAHIWGSYSNPKYFKCTLCGHLKLVTGPGITPINPPNKKEELEETE